MTGGMMPISVFTAAVLKSTPRVDREASTSAENGEASCDVKAEANNASFQLKANTRTDETTRPSSDSGKAIIQKICHGVAPSTLAASSISVLTSRKMSRMITTTKARLKVELQKIRPVQVSIR